MAISAVIVMIRQIVLPTSGEMVTITNNRHTAVETLEYIVRWRKGPNVKGDCK